MELRSVLATSAIALCMSVGAASAATVTFTSNGTFSNISGCSAGSPGCSIGENGNFLDMSGADNSWMRANDFGPSSFQTNATDVTLGKITWENNASGGCFFFTCYPTDPQFSVTYSLALSFTSPSADSASQMFMLTLSQTENNPNNPDTAAGFQIVGLPGAISLNGVTVSNFEFVVTTNHGSFANGVWTNPENKTSVLELRADFTAATAVPEPMSMALFGMGLIGLGAVARRKAQVA